MKLNDAQAHALDRLSLALPVTPKAMFGGVGLYSDGLFFALMDGERLYLKVDDANRPAFEARGLGPFRPYDADGPAMQYYPVPEDVLDDIEALREWALDALAVARRSRPGRGGAPRARDR